MRSVCVVFLVLVCMAASIRIDGVWPTTPIHEGFESFLRHAADPGKILSALLDDRISISQRLDASGHHAPAFSLEIADQSAIRKSTGTECG